MPLHTIGIIIALLPALLNNSGGTLKQPKTLRAILGVGIGTSLQEAHSRLDPLGVSGGRATREGGRKEAWTLRETEFSAIALKADKQGRVVWITGFVRPGQEIAFTRLGDLAQASDKAKAQFVWNFTTLQGAVRLVAKGRDDRASVLTLLSLTLPKKQTKP